MNNRRSFIVSILAVGCFIATLMLMPSVGTAQDARVTKSMAALKDQTAKLGAPKVEGNALSFGMTKMNNDVVDAVVKENGGAATLFLKAGNEYVRVATTLKKEDGSSAMGRP